MACNDPQRSGQNWTINFDGSVDVAGRAVRGAVDDFFAGGGGGADAHDRPGSTPELYACPRQVAATFEECESNTWFVRK